MIHFKENLTQQDAQWILDQWYVFDHRIAHPTLSKISEMHNKAFHEQVQVPGCSCEYTATHGVWCSRLSQYRAQIETIANPPVVEEAPKTRGRKKNG
jgi:hypothetical protein